MVGGCGDRLMIDEYAAIGLVLVAEVKDILENSIEHFDVLLVFWRYFSNGKLGKNCLVYPEVVALERRL